MKVGTTSLLWGAHCFLIHPFLVFRAWCRLFGFPWDLRVLCACFLHDIGYFQRGDMDGPDGEEHVILGACIMGWLFGPEWADECYRHSRYWAHRMGLPVSRLCLADKLAFATTPSFNFLHIRAHRRAILHPSCPLPLLHCASPPLAVSSIRRRVPPALPASGCGYNA